MSDDANAQKVPSTTYQRLAAHFDISDHKKVKKGGSEQTYIPWTDSVDRLNTVLGVGWSFRVIREGVTNTEAWALGEITATIDGVETVRQQYGCENIVMGQRETPVGDLFKKAATDALRKAATLLGVGLYLSVQDERAEIETAMRAEVQAAIQAERDKNKPKPTAAPAQSGKSVGPTPVHDAEKAAILTGANPSQPIRDSYRCTECATDVPTDATLTILRKKEGPKVAVAVGDFAPVCKERLGTFHCVRCYERKWFGAA